MSYSTDPRPEQPGSPALLPPDDPRPEVPQRLAGFTNRERQLLLDGINAVIKAKAGDLAFFSEALPIGPDRDRIVAELRNDLKAARSARRRLNEEL